MQAFLLILGFMFFTPLTWSKGFSALPYLPLDGESLPISTNGMKIRRIGQKVEVLFPRNQGSLVGVLDARNHLMQSELRNPRGIRIQWTTYLTPGKSFEVATDLGETGSATHWRTYSPSQDSTEKITILEEFWDPVVKQRRALFKKTVPGLQSACDSSDNLIPFHASTELEQIFARFEGQATCPKTPKDAGFEIMDTSAHTYSNIGPLCVDSTCNASRETAMQLFRETLTEGVGCLVDLGTKNLKGAGATLVQQSQAVDALSEAAAGSITTDQNAAFLKQTFALKNAAQLLLLINQGQGMASLWHNQEQSWSIITPDGNVHSGTNSEVQESTEVSPIGPIILNCSVQSGDLEVRAFMNQGHSVENQRPLPLGSIDVVSTSRVLPGFGASASASLPGYPAYPSIRLDSRALGVDLKIDSKQKAILFHELMHLLGYDHAQDQAAGEDMVNVPVHSACQVCCFPEGARRNHSIPSFKTKCDSYQKTFCEICSGNKGTTSAEIQSPEFKTVKADYAQKIKECYALENPF